MPVSPHRLHRVATDIHHLHQAESLRRKRTRRVFIDVSHHVHLALTPRARTMPAQFRDENESLGSIVPFYRQLPANLLHIRWSHDSNPTPPRAAAQLEVS